MIFDDMKIDLADLMKKFVKRKCHIKYHYDANNVIFYIDEENGIHIRINISCISDMSVYQQA